MEMRYLKAAGQFTQMVDQTKARLQRMAAEVAKAKPVPQE